MNRKRIWAAVLLLCMALTACTSKDAENPKNTEASSKPTESATPTASNPGETTVPTEKTDIPEATNPSDATEPEETNPTEESQETTDPTADAADTNVRLKLGCYDNDTAKMSLAFMEDGTVYLMEADGYWKGEYLVEDRQVELVFAYKTERGALSNQGELTIEGRSGSFHAVGDTNSWGPKLSVILSDGEISDTVTALIGSWYNETTESTLVFNADGTLYQVLSAAIMEGSCQNSEDGYILSFSLGGKVFGPYDAKLNGKGQLVLEGQEGVYIKQ